MTTPVQLGIPGLSLDVGDHVCAFYRGDAERDAILRSYLSAGLIAGDKCVCVLDDGDPDVIAAPGDIAVAGDEKAVEAELLAYAEIGVTEFWPVAFPVGEGSVPRTRELLATLAPGIG